MNLFDVDEEPVSFFCRQLEICSAWRSGSEERSGGSWTDGTRHVVVVAVTEAGPAVSTTSTATSTVTATATATASVSATASEMDEFGSCPATGHASNIHRVEFPVEDDLVSGLADRRLPLLLKYVRKNLPILSIVSQELFVGRTVAEESFPGFRCFFDPSILLVDQQRVVNELAAAKQQETGEGVDESTNATESRKTTIEWLRLARDGSWDGGCDSGRLGNWDGTSRGTPDGTSDENSIEDSSPVVDWTL